jgi:hypothetical protein
MRVPGDSSILQPRILSEHASTRRSCQLGLPSTMVGSHRLGSYINCCSGWDPNHSFCLSLPSGVWKGCNAPDIDEV